MGGGLMQLVAYGAQDIYLTGNPQITFFKVVYRRHTNFSMESIQQTWNGTIDEGARVTATISRNGDLVHRMYFQCATAFFANEGAGTANYGSAWIDNVVLEIGGQQIDKHYGHWMETWVELTEPQLISLPQSIQGGEGAGTYGGGFSKMTGMGGVLGAAAPTATPTFVPLQFWFCRNPGLALPLIALQYHEVKVILNIQGAHAAGGGPTLTGTDMNLWCDYIYLDTDERRRFAQVSHEYLIEQVQHQTGTTALTNDLNFNHPVKEIIWAGVGGVDTTADSSATVATITHASSIWNIKLNGHDRMTARPLQYYTRTQVWQHHSGPGGITPIAIGTTVGGNHLSDAIAVYSFALKPEEHQPSGTCNFSRIDNAQLVNSGSPAAGNINIYAVNYNVLRIMSGMGGLAYSN